MIELKYIKDYGQMKSINHWLFIFLSKNKYYSIDMLVYKIYYSLIS